MTGTAPAGPLLLAIVLALAVGTALGYALAVARSASARAGGRDEAAAARADAAQWQARAEELAERAQLAEERSERDGSVLRALAPVRAQLEQVGAHVSRMERSRAADSAALAEQLRAGADADRELRRITSSLEGALRSRSARGLWGEAELRRVLEASGMMPHIDFDEQRTASAAAGRAAGGSAGRGRPDVIVHLPGGGHVAVDAKAPMDAYLEASALDGAALEPADRERRRRELLEAHARALGSHVDALAGRHYDRALVDSPELVVLFVPAEPVLAAALETDPSLMDRALDLGVALAGPASLLAVLRTCATAWSRAAVNDDARELLELGRTLYERLGAVSGHLDALGRSLTRSVLAYNNAIGSFESRLLVTARSLDSLAGDLPSPAAIDADSAQVRTLTAPELSDRTA